MSSTNVARRIARILERRTASCVVGKAVLAGRSWLPHCQIRKGNAAPLEIHGRCFSSPPFQSSHGGQRAIKGHSKTFERLRETTNQLVTKQSLNSKSDTLLMKQVIRKWLDLTQSLFRSRSHDAISAVEQVDLIFRTLLAVLPRVSSEVVGSNLDTAIDAMEHVRNWARLGEARRAESFLQYQIDVSSSSAALQDCMPLDLAYASVINAFSKDSNKEALSKAVYWLGRMENPPVEAFNSVLNAYSNRGLAEEAAAFFQDMKSKTSVVQDVFSYATVMKAWARSKRDDAQDYIESLLAELKNIYEAQGHPRRLMPNSFVYSIAMTHASPQRAEALLRELNECYEFSGDKEVQPNMRHYVGAMTRWARAGKPQEAERLLLECQEAYKRGNETLRPNHQAFVVVIDAYAKQQTIESTKHAERLLDRLEEHFLDKKRGRGQPHDTLNNYGYNSVMNAYARTSTSATDAENIFYRMKTVAMQFDFPDLWPDNVSCTTLMRAWIHEAKPGFVTKVLGLLREMEESPNVKLHPDLVTYAVVLDALAQSGEELAGEKGEAILDQMAHRGLKPNRVCYNSVMTTYARQGDVDNAKKILEIMENEYAAGNLSSKPIARDYSSYIAALSELDSPSEENFQQSLELFMFIADRYKQGDKQFQVGGPILTSLMTLLAKTYTNDKIAIAKHVFKLAKEMKIPIDAVVYNTFLWVCSSISGSNDEKLEALELAVKSFQTMKNEGIQSDSHTFIYLMLCSRNLISDKDEQAAAIEEFFQRCCQEGLVNEAVLSHFQNFVPESHLLLELCHKNAGDMGHVPSQWRRAV